MARSNKSTGKRKQLSKLRLESLEQRELLAADFMTPETINLSDIGDDGAIAFVDSPQALDQNSRPRPDAGGRGDRPGPDEPTAAPGVDETAFASIDGTGNNLENAAWGSVGQALANWTELQYADGRSEPAGEDRLSARQISNIVVASPGDTENALGLSDLTWLFGQFIDHDIDLSEGGDEAFDIEVPKGDAWFDPFGTGEATIGLNRTDYVVDAGGVRHPFNEITAFIDGSVIYGSDQERADALRTFEGGMLATSEGDLLPFNVAGLDNAGGVDETLFLAGDIRANENVALTAMHTLWVREHNRVAAEIAESDPSLADEEIYQQARQFVTAELQSITYNEYLPALLGEDAISEYTGYDATVNPNIANVFSTAAYRFGHSMLSSELLRLNNDGTMVDAGNLDLQEAFFNPSVLTDNGIESLLLGASVQTAQEVDPFVVDDVRNFLFGPPGAGGFDLASLNIQRGRDHGLADYNQIRVDMGLEAVTSFADISSDPEIQRRLEEAYADVNSIDAWVGMLAEDHVTGSTLGITATTIIAEQFTRLRDGDRFYYENVFSGSELQQLENTTLADVIERNTTINFSRDTNVFYASDDGITADAGADRIAGPEPGEPVNPAPAPEEPLTSPPRTPAATDQFFAAIADDNDDDDRRRRRRG